MTDSLWIKKKLKFEKLKKKIAIFEFLNFLHCWGTCSDSMEEWGQLWVETAKEDNKLNKTRNSEKVKKVKIFKKDKGLIIFFSNELQKEKWIISFQFNTFCQSQADNLIGL